jgi:hypothetical protein
VPASQRPLLEPTVRDLLEKKRDLLDTLTGGFADYLTELSELEVSNRRLVSDIREFASYIDERVLWVRSADVLHPGDVADVVKCAGSMVRPEPWIELSKT